MRIEAIFLNSVDPLYVAHPLANSCRTIGSDFAGTVEAVGTQVPSTRSTGGDRVAGFLQGACSVSDRPGAFADYLVVPWNLMWKIPNTVTIEEAAGVSLVDLTAAQSIWYRRGLEASFAYDRDVIKQEHPEWLRSRASEEPEVLNCLVYGASTSVGLDAPQMARTSARTSGRTMKQFGVASKVRWSLLKEEPYSCDHLVDHRDIDWHEQIRRLLTGEGMHYVYNAISEGDAVYHNSTALAHNGRMAIMRSRESGAWTSEGTSVEQTYGAVWEGHGEEILYQGLTVPKSLSAGEFAVQFYQWLSTAMGSELKPISTRLMPGGLDKILNDWFITRCSQYGEVTVNSARRVDAAHQC